MSTDASESQCEQPGPEQATPDAARPNDPGQAAADPSPVPAEPTAEEAEQAKQYSLVTLRCTIADMALDLAVLLVMALAAGPAIDAWLSGWGWLAGDRSLLRLAALGVSLTALHSLVSLPLSFYSGYMVEHRFGLSTQDVSAWFKSWIKRSLLTLVLLAGMYTVLFAIIWAVGEYWWLVAALAFFAFSALLGQLLPVVILPLFYKVDRVEDEEAAQRMQAMASDAGLTIEGVFRLGMSAETTKANAMLAGMGSTRRVLMGDTLLEQFSPGEIDVVFAHELGHHVHRHLPKLLLLAGATALVGFFACHLVLGAWTGVSDPTAWPTAALPKVILSFTLFSLLIGPVQNLFSRHFERQADRYAVDKTGDLASFRSAFLKLARMNKAELDPNPIEVFLLHSHPPIGERLALVGADAEGTPSATN